LVVDPLSGKLWIAKYVELLGVKKGLKKGAGPTFLEDFPRNDPDLSPALLKV